MSELADRLDEIQRRCDAATEGPWAPWLDQDGAPHMGGMLMVGNVAGVIPDGETWIEGVDVNPVAHTYTPEDRAFIAHARTDMPRLVAALRAVLAVVERDEEIVAHNDGVPITRIGELIARPLPREYRSAIESALRADS